MNQEVENQRYNLLERRRQKILEIHRQRRQQLFNKSRRLFDDDCSYISEEESSMTIQNSQIEEISMKNEMEVENNIEKCKNQKFKKKKNKRQKKYAKILQIPDWMNSVPQNFDQFLGAARPNGKVGLLVFQSSKACIYNKAGNIVVSFDPKKKNYEGIVLQVLYEEKSKHIYITDMISWKGNIFTNEEFQFRLGWLSANYMTLKLPNVNISLINFYPMTVVNLKIIYEEDFGYEKQGLLFVHKQSPYVHQVNPNVLIWKDWQTSKFPMDQAQKGDENSIYGTGKIKNGRIVSQQNFYLAKLPEQHRKQRGFVRFKVYGIVFCKNSISEDDINSTPIFFEHFQIVNYKGYSKFRADPISRIIFQHRIRKCPLTILEIADKLSQQK